MQEVLRLNASGDVEWSYMEKDIPAVIIHDRLMTDAALGTRPIKTEHSYSLASDGDSLPDSPISHNKLEGNENSARASGSNPLYPQTWKTNAFPRSH